MEEFHRGSSSVTRLEIHVSYKVKYCHKVFDISEVKQRCQEIFFEVAALHRITIKEIGFDGDHVHMDIMILHTQRLCDINKAFKGTSGKKILQEFPEIKRKYFWGSGLWGGQAYGDSVGRDPTIIRNYVKNQGVGRKEMPLSTFFKMNTTSL
ncbi:MAG TPA: IS200/IS605 family transposase [archaeon]|nr:IS200/IS605 family transposase [archaeon]